MEVNKDKVYSKKAIKYRELIEELMLDQPDEVKIKKMMDEVNVKYTSDPIERLNLMLQVLHIEN